jgi:hypothetical protein
MKTLEQKRDDNLTKYITNEEIKNLLNSEEMNRLVETMKIWEEYRERTKDISIGIY